jgi:hypothetical protein
MLIPWRVVTACDRSQLRAALAHFTGEVFLPTHAGVGELQRRVANDINSQQDIWIATGRTEHPLSLFSLLHARVEPGAEAGYRRPGRYRRTRHPERSGLRRLR